MRLGTWILAGVVGVAGVTGIGFAAARGTSCCVPNAAAVPMSANANAPATVAGVSTISLSIEGMTCASCAIGVRRALKSVDGVADVKMIENGAVVQYDPTKATTAQMIAAVDKLGYKTSVRPEAKG